MRKNYSVGAHERSNFFELWQQQTQLKTMEMNGLKQWGSLTWYLRWGICTSLPTWTHSQNSVVAVEMPSLKTSSHGTSHISDDQKDRPNQHESSRTVRWNWHNIIRISQWRGSHCKTNTRAIRKTIQKSRTVRVTVWDPSRKVNHLSTLVWNIKYNNIFKYL